MIRQAIMPPLWELRRDAASVRGDRDRAGGSGGGLPIDLAWSDDGGWHFIPAVPRHLTTGTTGRSRVFTTRLGSFRQRSFKVTGSGNLVLYALDADIAPGTS